MAPASPFFPYAQRVPGAKVRLVCFPHSGGSAAFFRPWARALQPGIELSAVQLPGREGRFREAPFLAFDPLVSAVTEAVRPLLDMPVAFFGHSLGAAIAFEVARRLQQEGRPPLAHLVVSAHEAPQAQRETRAIHSLTEEAFVERLRRLGGTPPAVLDNRELLELLLPVLRADYEVYDSYVYREGPPLCCPLSVLGGKQDASVPPTDLEGWSVHSSDFRGVHLFEGGHFYLSEQPPFLPFLAERVLGKR